MGAAGVLAVGLAAILSSPDVSPVTIQSWAQKDPVDLVTTATGELAGSTTSAAYGAPYNTGRTRCRASGFFSPQAWFGRPQPGRSGPGLRARAAAAGELSATPTSDRARCVAVHQRQADTAGHVAGRVHRRRSQAPR